VRVTTLSPTRRHWSRGERRLKATVARTARKRNEAQKRKRLLAPIVRIRPGKGPTPRNPENAKEQAA
jgi:hypothetical protein